MTSLAEYFDESGSDISSVGSEEQIHEWRNVTASQIDDLSIVTSAIDGMLLEQAKTEIKAVCKNVREMFDKQTNSDVSFNDVTNYFLSAV